MSTGSDEHFGCATCGTAAAFRGDTTRMPPTCPTLTHPAVAKDATPYLEPERAAVMRAADATPFTPERTRRNRVEELVHFAKGRGLSRLGVAFCVSMTKEAQALGRRLSAEGLEHELVCCRVGAIDYDEVGLTKQHPERFAATCNPVAQARLLNEAKVQLVVQLGLCLGHDLILQEQANAPVTTLVVKDRALDHHPITALRPAEKPP
jgi:uncharacterized metal-binding protein